ncbi:hypothetical protein ACFO5R_17915 [Halosolutus amylolyticus]|uniref:Uncharacterized protein n=1 Tax=Halosolutus amylolyticus TaxID=2932267 RepID=A0ABD5PTI0_9EURY|nr:hypothetical protein [Halosolutus amylolyticus]
MNRRAFLCRLSVASLPALGAGCTAAGLGESNDDAVRSYTLSMADPRPDPDGSAILDFDHEGLSFGQRELVDEAVRTGAYAEDDVSWGSIPGREPITMEFRMVLQTIARHVDHETAIDFETRFETPAAFDGERYRAIVAVDG